MRAVSLGIASVTLAIVFGAFAGTASAITLDEIEDAGSVIVHASHDWDAGHAIGREFSLDLSDPDYAPAVAPLDSGIRDQLDTVMDRFGDAIRDQENALTDDESEQHEISGCLKGVLWDIGWDSGWDASNGYQVNLNQEMANSYSRLANCFAERLGLGALQADSVRNYFLKTIAAYGTEALDLDPMASSYVEWATVTSWYGVPG
jgi:hypothetical protein